MVEVYRLSVTELTGQQRSISLGLRALPYQGVEFSTEQRSKKTNYGANPEASIQVMGVNYPDTTLKGMWKDRFMLPDTVRLTGFGIPANEVRAQTLVDIFDSICSSGNMLRVSLGPRERTGILKEFTPNYIRTEDIEWSMRFEWSKQQYSAPRGSSAGEAPSNSQMVSSWAQVEYRYSLMPPSIDKPFADAAKANMIALRTAYVTLSSTLAIVNSESTPTEETVFLATTTAQQIRELVAHSATDLACIPYTYSTPLNGQVDTMLADWWRRDLYRAQRYFSVIALKSCLALQNRIRTNQIALVTVGFGQTLRSISLKYYGTADLWRTIAIENNLPDSVVPVGLVVRVPLQARRSAQ